MADDQNLEAQNPDEGAGKEAVVPEWVPEKFRANPEKFGESYQNLEREFHQTKQDLRVYQEQVEELVAAQSQSSHQESQTQQVNPYYAAYEQAMESGDYVRAAAVQDELNTLRLRQVMQESQATATKPILEQQNQLLAYTANQMVAQRVPDWADYQERVGDEISRNPDLLPETALASPERAAAALERVYKQVRHDDLLNQNKTLAEQQVDLQRQAKLAAQTLSGSAGRPSPTDDEAAAWERIKNAPSTSYTNLVNGR